MLTKETFSASLKEERKRLGIPQEKMAWLLGMSTRGYCNWEHGINAPHAIKMAGVLDLLRKLPAVSPKLNPPK